MAWIVDDTRNENRHAWTNYSEQATNNAWEFYNYFVDRMTIEALCGILGNVTAESHINPLQEQVFNTTPLPPQRDRGLGLIQWTPQGDLTEFCDDYHNGNDQCGLIMDEIMGVVGGRFFPSVVHPEYSYSGSEFIALTDIEEATKAYFWERERGTWNQSRVDYANHWYEVFQGEPPVPPVPPVPPSKYKGMPLYFYITKRFKRRKGLI